MKKMIKILCMVMCVCMLLTFASAANISTKAGETIEYTVSLAETVSLAGFKVYVNYDTDVFSLASVDEEFVVEQGSFSTKGTMLANTTENGCSVLWYYTNNVSASGSLFTLTLEVASDAEPGVYPVTLSYEAEDTVNVEEEEVEITLSGDSIEVQEVIVSEETEIYTNDCEVVVGNTISVPVMIKNNPGFSGFAFKVAAIDGITLTGIKKGSLLSSNETGSMTVNETTGIVNWVDSEETTGDGELLVLTFDVPEDCIAGDYDIDISLLNDAPLNFVDVDAEAIAVQFNSGTLTVLDYLIGDVDDDGEFTVADAVLMAKHIVGLDTLDDRAFAAADIDGDGEITAADCVKLARFLVGLIEEL